MNNSPERGQSTSIHSTEIKASFQAQLETKRGILIFPKLKKLVETNAAPQPHHRAESKKQ